VGNITVGGTGKTPFVEYLVRALSPDYRVAVLSRGYRRTTKGFRLANAYSTPGEIGDEPCQIKRKYPHLIVAVDADRVAGIARIREAHPDVRIVLLDDAFQYRRIRPNCSILLADYHRPLYRDSVLPWGRLREWACFARRADVMVITKSPADIADDEQQRIAARYARIFPHPLFFAAIGYGHLLPVFAGGAPFMEGNLRRCNVLLVTGIAQPKPLEACMRQCAASVHTVVFPDHHAFAENDIAAIARRWNAKPPTNKILITTEKDAVRLQHTAFPDALAARSYYIPVEVNFIGDRAKEAFEAACLPNGI
jgi:tetraacyldisaccharide 4'-kinase